MKTLFFAVTLSLFSFSVAANVSSIRCSFRAQYEIFRGEGMVEKGEGSVVTLPVSFGFFTNEDVYSAKFAGGNTSLIVKASATPALATINMGGGLGSAGGFSHDVSFSPVRGLEQTLEAAQLSSFNYTYPGHRVSFTRATLKCSPSEIWNQKPRLTEI